MSDEFRPRTETVCFAHLLMRARSGDNLSGYSNRIMSKQRCRMDHMAPSILGWTEAEMLGQTLERMFTDQHRQRDILGNEMRDALAYGCEEV